MEEEVSVYDAAVEFETSSATTCDRWADASPWTSYVDADFGYRLADLVCVPCNFLSMELHARAGADGAS